MKPKHAPCACGCGDLADECMSGGGNPLAAFTIEPPVADFHRAEGHIPGWARTDSGQFEPTCRCGCIPTGTGRTYPDPDAARDAAADILAGRGLIAGWMG